MSNSHEVAQRDDVHTDDALAERDEHAVVPRPADEVPDPDSEWGHNGSFPKLTMGAGVFSAFALVAMLIGNHTGRIEDLYLVGFAVLVLAGIALQVRKQRNAWRR